MGGVYSRLFKTEVRDVLLAATYGLLSSTRQHSSVNTTPKRVLQSDVNRRVARLVFMVAMYASNMDFEWDDAAQRVHMRDSLNEREREVAWKKVLVAVEKRVPTSELWDVDRSLNESLSRAHEAMYSNRVAQRFMVSTEDGDDGIPAPPPSSVETMMRVAALAAREACEVFLLEASTRMPSALESISREKPDGRAPLFLRMLPHVNEELRRMALAYMTSMLAEEILVQARRIMASRDSILANYQTANYQTANYQTANYQTANYQADEEDARRVVLDPTARVMADRMMMAVVDVQLLGPGVQDAVLKTKRPMRDVPSGEPCLRHLYALIRHAFSSAYDSRAPAYVGGRDSAAKLGRLIAENTLSLLVFVESKKEREHEFRESVKARMSGLARSLGLPVDDASDDERPEPEGGKRFLDTANDVIVGAFDKTADGVNKYLVDNYRQVPSLFTKRRWAMQNAANAAADSLTGREAHAASAETASESDRASESRSTW
jgi:hypothetical protein